MNKVDAILHISTVCAEPGVKAGNENSGGGAVLYAVGTPGDTFTINTSVLGNKGVSHIVLFGREGNVPNAVPEPAAWAMMLGGFGLLGGGCGAVRLRRLPSPSPLLQSF